MIIEEDAKGLADPLVVQPARTDREVQVAGLVDLAGDAKRLARCILVPHEVDQDYVEVYSLIARFVPIGWVFMFFIGLAIIDVR